MNTQRKHEILNELDTMRKRVELLESHKVVGMITDEQYQESGLQMQNRLRELEEECGIDRPIFHAKGLMYDDEAKLFDEVQKSISEVMDGIVNQNTVF